MTSRVLKHVLIAIVGLSLMAVSAPAFSADVTGKTSTQTLPTQTNTQTAPLPSNTTTTPLPSNIQTTVPTREYQKVNKPPVKTLDIPVYDIAGQLRISDIRKSDKCYIYFTVELMNKGSQGYIKDDVQIRVILINVRDNAQFAGIQYP